MLLGAVADRATVVDGLRAALASSGLNQAEFARALGTSASRLSTYLRGRTDPGATLVARAARLGSALGEAARGGWMTAPSTAAVVRVELTRSDEIWALKMALQGRDDLREMLRRDLDCAAGWEARPGSTGSQIWDRLLAALAAHEFTVGGYLAPEWTAGIPTEPKWMLRSPFLTEHRTRDQTPPWLAERGLFISERDLTTV